MTVTVKMLVDKLKLKVVYGNEELLAKAITTADISRPGLEMAGYFDYYSPERLQLVGMKEWTYLKTMTANNRYSVFANIFRKRKLQLLSWRVVLRFQKRCFKLLRKMV